MSPYDELPAMLWLARPDMSCEYANRAWLEYTGCAADAADSATVVHAEDLARWLDTCVRAYDARTPYAIEYRMRRADGVYRWVLERGVPRSSDTGFAGYSALCLDIDERKRAEAAAAGALERERRLRLAIEEASHAKDRLLASVLAELESPTAAVGTWAGRLRAELAPESVPLERPLDAPLLAGVRVLVVEEDAEARDLLLKVLRAAGAEAFAVAGAAQALSALEDWHPDVLLSDAGLPGHDGYVLLRAHPAARRVLSAAYDAELAKPIEPVALLATVAHLVQPPQA
ncbi:MAG: PAS domain-containing protein [Burkholderiales bacterium]